MARYHTLINHALAIMSLGNTVMPVEGCWVEVGVHNGVSAMELAKVIKSPRKLWLFDTFHGHPEIMCSEHDGGHTAGKYSGVDVDKLRKSIRAAHPLTEIVQGVFPDTAGALKGRPIALAHIDVDLYLSVLACCRVLYPLMSLGGVMVFDDYGYASAPGCKLAVDQYAEEAGIETRTMGQQAVISKE